MNTASHLQPPSSPTRDFAEQHMHTILARLAGPGAVPRAALGHVALFVDVGAMLGWGVFPFALKSG
jgi:hypothetical protein